MDDLFFGDSRRQYCEVRGGKDGAVPTIVVGFYLEEYDFTPTREEAREIGRRLLDWADADALATENGEPTR